MRALRQAGSRQPGVRDPVEGGPLAHRPSASRPAALHAPTPNSPKEVGSGAGGTPGRRSRRSSDPNPRPPVTDNSKLRPGRLTPSRRLAVRPAPGPRSQSRSPEERGRDGGGAGAGLALRDAPGSQPPGGSRRLGIGYPAGSEAPGRTAGRARPHCPLPAGSGQTVDSGIGLPDLAWPRLGAA